MFVVCERNRSKVLVVEVPRDRFHQWEGPADRVGRQSQLAVDMPEDEHERFLHLVQVRGREGLVQQEPVSAMDLTVAWERFAFRRQSMTILTSSLRSWSSIVSSALSKLSKKLISCEAVPEVTFRVSLVTD